MKTKERHKETIKKKKTQERLDKVRKRRYGKDFKDLIEMENLLAQAKTIIYGTLGNSKKRS